MFPSRNSGLDGPRTKAPIASPALASRRLPPLTPQSEVFKRALPEKDGFFEPDERRQPASSRNYDKRSYLGVEKPDDRYPDKSVRVFDERVKVKEEDTARSPPKQPRVRDVPTRPRNREVATTSPVRDVDSTPRPSDVSQRKKNVENVVELFRKLAKYAFVVFDCHSAECGRQIV